jgi:hypothetical protein
MILEEEAYVANARASIRDQILIFAASYRGGLHSAEVITTRMILE